MSLKAGSLFGDPGGERPPPGKWESRARVCALGIECLIKLLLCASLLGGSDCSDSNGPESPRVGVMLSHSGCFLAVHANNYYELGGSWCFLVFLCELIYFE